MVSIQSLLLTYGAISLATTLFFWMFTLIGFFQPDLRKDAAAHGLTLLSALAMGLLMGVTWPKSMLNLFKFIHKNSVKEGSNE